MLVRLQIRSCAEASKQNKRLRKRAKEIKEAQTERVEVDLSEEGEKKGEREGKHGGSLTQLQTETMADNRRGGAGGGGDGGGLRYCEFCSSHVRNDWWAQHVASVKHQARGSIPVTRKLTLFFFFFVVSGTFWKVLLLLLCCSSLALSALLMKRYIRSCHTYTTGALK